MSKVYPQPAPRLLTESITPSKTRSLSKKLSRKVTVKPEQSKFKQLQLNIDLFMQAPAYEILMTLITFIVLYADDVRILALSKDKDEGYYIFMLICFFIFAVEIVLLSIVRPGYAGSFYFWMDMASTFSTVMEIPLVMSDMLGIDAFSSSKSTKLAKAGRASRVSSRATKIIRVVRLIRLVRIAKLYRYAYRVIEDNFSHLQTEEDVGLSARPNISQGDSTIRFELTQNNQEARTLQKSTLEKNGRSVFMDQIVELPVKREKSGSNLSSSSESSEEEKNCDPHAQEKLLIEQGGEGLHAEVETQVGKILSDLTTRRAIMVMFSIMISIPLLQYDTYFSDLSGYESGLTYLEETFNHSSGNIVNGYKKGSDALLYMATQVDQSTVLFFQLSTYKIVDHFQQVLKLRDDELRVYSSNNGVAVLMIDNKETANLEAILGIIRTSFVVVILVVGAIYFSKDSNDIVVVPIENMLAKVKRISKNPLEAARIEKMMQIAEKQLKAENLENKLQNEKQQQSGFETVILERLIVKTGALLAVGFGEAGCSIIAHNMNKDGDVDPMIPGQKVFAIFGFCDIRNFIDMTEILEERVMLFVNEIASIVHQTVNNYEGSANKYKSIKYLRNIGDAFLIVWKFPRDAIQLKRERLKILSARLVNNVADMALISFVKIFMNVRRSKAISQFYSLPEVKDRLPNASIKMGFGLHAGWAIEGTIGSKFKIDASYLSPNVNLASRLEAATRQYGVSHLVSGSFYRLLSVLPQGRLRQIDRVTVKGSIQPVDLYTFDFDVNAVEDIIQRQQIKDKDIRKYFERRQSVMRMENIRKSVVDVESIFEYDESLRKIQAKFTKLFYETFKKGVEFYINGKWMQAKECLEVTKEMLASIDSPSVVLLNYMREYDYEAPGEWVGHRVLTDK